MNKLNFFGVGPKIGLFTIPWMVVTIILSQFSSRFSFTSGDAGILKIPGFVLLVLGLILYFSTVKFLLKGLKETRLVTKGGFYLCQNPLYSAIILFLIPAISFLLNSWLVLTTSLVGYFMFKLYIRGEYQILEKLFGDEYLKYKSETPEFFPFPLTKWIKKK